LNQVCDWRRQIDSLTQQLALYRAHRDITGPHASTGGERGGNTGCLPCEPALRDLAQKSM
jgi:hypothetical protein